MRRIEIVAAAALAAGCGVLDGERCDAEFTLVFPEGGETTLKFCKTYGVAATYESDPDEAPEMRSFALLLSATNEDGAECGLELEQMEVCGTGYYGLGDDGTALAWATFDCEGVGDDDEDIWSAYEGWLHLEEIGARERLLDRREGLISTSVTGSLQATSLEGATLSGSFDVTIGVAATDVEEGGECGVHSGDNDGDGYLTTEFGGDDCDDERAWLHPWGADQCGWRDVGAGGFYTCALDSAGAPICWGSNGAGQLEAPAGPFTQVSAGYRHACAIDSAGAITCWGDDAEGQASPPAGSFAQVSAGGEHTCARDAAGVVTCWGDDQAGQVSDAPIGAFADVSAGDKHNCAVDIDGAVVCWGRDKEDQTDEPSVSSYVQVSAGFKHTCGVKEGGDVKCWGEDEEGQATAPGEGRFYVAVGAGEEHSCALDDAGDPICWGDDRYGQTYEPSGVFTSISVGSYHACAITDEGGMRCWGDDEYGQSDSP